MEYQIILEKDDYALILRGSQLREYAVVKGLNKETGTWDWTCCYYSFAINFNMNKVQALSNALECFREKTEKKIYSTM